MHPPACTNSIPFHRRSGVWLQQPVLFFHLFLWLPSRHLPLYMQPLLACTGPSGWNALLEPYLLCPSHLYFPNPIQPQQPAPLPLKGLFSTPCENRPVPTKCLEQVFSDPWGDPLQSSSQEIKALLLCSGRRLGGYLHLGHWSGMEP